MLTARPWIALIGSAERQNLGVQSIHELRARDIEGDHGAVADARLPPIVRPGDDEHGRAYSPSPTYVLVCRIDPSRAHVRHERIVERNRFIEPIRPNHHVI